MTRLFSCVFLLLLLLVPVTPSGASSVRSWPDRQWGSKDGEKDGETGGAVRTAQSFLSARGYKVVIDGVFGRQTEAALKKFQRDHHLVQTGETNTPTWEALVMPIHRGSTGPTVAAAQFLLNQAGYAIAQNGVFGPEMQADVKKYQAQTGHTADGLIGSYTWCELVGGNADEQGD